MATEFTNYMQAGTEYRLNPGMIRVLSWNIMKQFRPQLHHDLAGFSKDVDLALLQEVHVEGSGLGHFDESWHRSFTAGFRLPGITTGVMTLSGAFHRTQDSYRHAEPLLRTPKAANLSTYGLEGLDESLLVVNLHAVNYSLGLSAWRGQLEDLLSHMDSHQGPVIFAGDFNTWHRQRKQLLEQRASHHGLKEVAFEDDRRTRVFGRCLDYMFVRGLDVIDAVTHHSEASDHNPLMAMFALRRTDLPITG